MTKNAYIHIPFCKGKCKYCSFVSFDKLSIKDEYLNALIHQIKTEYKNEQLDTLYFGGGTPSLLDIKDFRSLIDLFSFEQTSEITVEVNPESVNESYLKDLKALGINRLSIGSQTFDDEILKVIGRKHNAEQIKSALHYAKNAKFNNINLDFIYGLPNQTLQGFENDLKTAIDLGVQHISLYGLKLENDCYFHKYQPKKLPDSDIQADMYLKAIEILKNNGFEHYEISNFAKVGFESRHNLNYWNNNTYYAFGCSASGYIDKIRYQLEPNLEKYIQEPLKRDFKQELTEQEILEEEIFLGFRKSNGIDVVALNHKFGIDFNTKYSEILEKYSNYFLKTNSGWALNVNGMLISNEILSEFISY